MFKQRFLRTFLESLGYKSTECNFQLLNNGNYGTSPLCFHRWSECSFTAIIAKWMSKSKRNERQLEFALEN